MKGPVMQFMPVAILGIGVLLISGMREQHIVPPVQPMTTISRSFGGLEGRDLVVDSVSERVAGMSDYTMREFGKDSSPLFTVYVGYYDRQVQGKTIHSPKNCMPGAGWDVLTSERVVLPGGPTAGSYNKVVLANSGARALVLYWYQGRGRIESNEYKVKWNLLRDAALFGRTEEALVRIIVPVDATISPEAGLADADALTKRLIAPLINEVAKVMPAAPSA